MRSCWILLLLATTATTRRMQLFGWHLHLHENPAIRSPYYDECKFYTGRVIHEQQSSVTLTECNGQLYGLLQIGTQEFIVQPKNRRKRDASMTEQETVFDLSEDTVSDLDLDPEDAVSDPDLGPEDAPAHVVMRPKHAHAHDDRDYFRDVLPVTRPVSGVDGLWLEMAIVADHTMVKFHGRERVEHYILALMNIVSAIFNEPSLNSNMTLVINKLFLYEEPVIRHGNMKKTLDAVNRWNYRHLMKLPPDSTGWDAAVWLSRAALGGPSGFAPVAGVCTRARAAAVVRDEGLTSAFVIAHELGHLLGLTHDNEPECSVERNRGSVMAPTVLATLHNYTWSKCSRRQFQEKSRKWWCLHQRSADDGVELGGTRALSNYVFTMDDQCRTEFGEGFSVCKSVKVKSACSRLWCAHRAMPHVCRSKRGPPLEGTPCGNNHWCVDRVCEPMPGHEDNTVEGEDLETGHDEGEDNNVEGVGVPAWGAWEGWEGCSAECGYGLRVRRRRCRHKGTSTSSPCSGPSWQAVSCWSGPCPASRDLRADACSRRHKHFIPRPQHESKACENWCVDYTGGEASSSGPLPDGTPCSYSRPYDICYQGTCIKGECNATDWSCNWCPEGYCNNNTHLYSRTLGKGWTRLTVIPHEAHQLSVRISTPVPLHIALRERKREKPILELGNHQTKLLSLGPSDNYLRYDPSVPQNLQIVEIDSNVIDIKEERPGWQGEVVTGGTLLQWNQTDTEITITAVSALQTDLMIMAIPEHPISSEDQLVGVQVAVNFSTPAVSSRSAPLEYRWSLQRGACSASCGGGVRVVRTRCMQPPCAPHSYERCNTHSCSFVWAPGEWESCSSTCGDQGLQERQLFCVPSNVSVSSRRELVRHSVSPALCAVAQLDNVQPCNRIPCPVYWQELPWTPCSTTCGRGISRRPLVCPTSPELLCGPRPRERRRRCRLRRCPAARAPLGRACLQHDASQYCELFSTEQLLRNCVVPPFMEYCCNACREVMRP